jgi:hypothetical protein
MKHDIELPLTAAQYDRLKQEKELRQGIKNILPETKVARIATYLQDSDYDLHLVRPYKGEAAYLRLRLGSPRIFIPLPPKLSSSLAAISGRLGITVNQFINAAIKSRLDDHDKSAGMPELQTV